MRIVLTALALLFAVTLPAAATQFADGEIKLVQASGLLSGTLDLPVGRKIGPTALILPGSGPTDRNGNGPALHTNAYQMLADALAERGFATLRYDKRGIGGSRSALRAESDLRIRTYVDDAKHWTRAVSERIHPHCIWLIGHSEGALIAEMVADEEHDICGLVLIAGPGRKAGDLLREQLAGLPDDLKKSAWDTLAVLEAGNQVAAPPAELAALFRPSVQPYLISLLQLDPAALLQKVDTPVLIIQGDNDLQVTVNDAQRLAAAQPNAKLVVLAGMNHIMKLAPTDRAANLATYGDRERPLAPDLADDIADFIEANSK